MRWRELGEVDQFVELREKERDGVRYLTKMAWRYAQSRRSCKKCIVFSVSVGIIEAVYINNGGKLVSTV